MPNVQNRRVRKIKTGPNTEAHPTLPTPEELASELVRHPAHLLRRTNQIFLSLFEAELGGVGLTPVHWIVLAMLYAHPGTDMTRLGGYAAIDLTTCGRTVDRLRRAGLVQVTMADSDRRQKLLGLTKAGLVKLTEALPGVRQLAQSLLSGMSAEEKRLFMLCLNGFVTLKNEQSRAPHRPLERTYSATDTL